MSPKEIKLLECLVTSGKSICTRKELIKHMWGDVFLNDFDNSLKVIASRARTNLAELGVDVEITATVNVGYGIDIEHHAKVRKILADIIKRKTGVDVPWAEVA